MITNLKTKKAFLQQYIKWFDGEKVSTPKNNNKKQAVCTCKFKEFVNKYFFIDLIINFLVPRFWQTFNILKYYNQVFPLCSTDHVELDGSFLKCNLIESLSSSLINKWFCLFLGQLHQHSEWWPWFARVVT